MENPPFEDVFPIENGDIIPASYVSLQEGFGRCSLSGRVTDFLWSFGDLEGENFPNSLHFASMIMANQPTPPGHVPPPRNEGLIAGLIKGNQWLISP